MCSKGGISSYGLSLMVARYLQEQSSGADVGSLLMGFLDFYGNHVCATIAIFVAILITAHMLLLLVL